MNKDTLTVAEHIRELKVRTAICLIILLIFSLVVFLRIDRVFTKLLVSANEYGYRIITLSPQETITQEVKLTCIIALFLAAPVLIYNTLSYILQPVTFGSSIRMILAIAIIEVLFLCGAGFAFKVILPNIFRFLREISKAINIVDTTVTVDRYVSLLIGVLAIFGCIMEMPVITIILTGLGIVRYTSMKRFRSYVIVAVFIIAAIITPPDILSQLLVAIPMLLIYEICIVISHVCIKKERKTGIVN